MQAVLRYRNTWGRKNESHLLAGEIQYRDSSKSNSNGLPRFGVGDAKAPQCRALAREFNISLSTVHDYIEEQRDSSGARRSTSLRVSGTKPSPSLITRLRKSFLTSMGRDHEIATARQAGLMTVEEWQARIKACDVLTKLLDRKAKLLGMDASVKVEAPPVVAPETEEQRARAREALKTWCKFQVDPQDFQGKDLG